MDSGFEKQFSELQAGMVSVCLEYCEHKCDQIYIHIICENDTVFSNFFFRNDGVMRRKNRLNDIDAPISPERQKEALSYITDNARKAMKLCADNARPIPTEFKLVYTLDTNNMKAEYGYEPVTAIDKSDRNISDEWFRYLVSSFQNVGNDPCVVP